MRVTIVSVGRLGRSPVADAVREYERRAARYFPLSSVEVRQEQGRSLSPDDVRAREWDRLAAASVGRLVVCDERGRSMTSHAFAELVGGGDDLTFAIGGAYGLPDAARSSAAIALALAPWTLSHDLARLVLAEQLYRAGTILRGEPYHK